MTRRSIRSATPTSATSSTSSTTSPTRRRPARAELPLDADDPRRRQRGHRQQREPEGEAPVDRRRARRADHGRRARRRARRGPLRRLGDRAAGRRGDAARPDRGLLPDERAEPGARGHAGALRDPLPGDRRDEVLRPGRDQGRGRLPAACSPTPPTRSPSPGSSTRRGAGSASRPRRGCSRTRTRSATTSGTSSPTPRRSRRWARRRSRPSAASPSRWPGLRERAERGGPVAELLEAVLHESGYIEALEAERTVEAEGRVENLEELVGVAGEFDANRELEGESEMTPAGGVPGPDLALLRAGQPARRREPGRR